MSVFPGRPPVSSRSVSDPVRSMEHRHYSDDMDMDDVGAAAPADDAQAQETGVDHSRNGEEGLEGEEESANDDGGELEENDAEEGAAHDGDGGDEGVDAADNSEGDGAENAAEAAADGAPAQVAALDPPVQSELRGWLQNFDANGSNTGRFEAYAAAFEAEFDSLEDLVIAADAPSIGLEAVLDRCDVRSLGDRARMQFAVAKFPRPE